MRIFIAKHHKTQLKVTFKYDLNELLRVVEFEGDWDVLKIGNVLNNATTSTALMLEKIKKQDLKSGWIFAELSDVTFAYFYKNYPRKVGPKELTEKQYSKLSNVEKMEAILFIPELIKLKGDGTAFPYPATYLKQKYWK